MTRRYSKLTKEIASIDFTDWTTTLWIVKRRLIQKEAKYTVLRVKIEDKLNKKLKNIVLAKAIITNSHIEKYDFLSGDQDDAVLTLRASETDFANILNAINNGFTNKTVDSFEELQDSWAYVIELRSQNLYLLALRKITEKTNIKRKTTTASFLFKNHTLLDIDEGNIFTIDRNIDFFVYKNISFILNKHNFETAMNFREGMEKNRDSVVQILNRLNIFTDVAIIKKTIGNNLRLLRKISSIKKSAYYLDTNFIKKLFELNTTEGWDLLIQDEKIVVTEDKIDLILTLLNNSRLKSPINSEVFDATVKKKVVK